MTSLFEVEAATPKAKKVPLSAIEVIDVPKGDAEAMKRSLQATGLQQPVLLLCVAADQPLQILAGKRRVAGARLAGWKELDARVRMAATTSEVEAAALTLTENAVRSFNPMAEADAIGVLLAGGMDEKGIAKHLGKSTAWVAQRTKLLGLLASLQEAVRHGRMTLATALEAAKLSLATQARLVEGKDPAKPLTVSLPDVRALTARPAASVDALFTTDLQAAFTAPPAGATAPTSSPAPLTLPAELARLEALRDGLAGESKVWVERAARCLEMAQRYVEAA